MKRLKYCCMVLIVLVIGATSFIYLKSDGKSNNLLAVDYSKDKDYALIFDTNGGNDGNLSSMTDSGFVKLRDGVYGTNNSITFSAEMEYINKDNKYVLYWSLDYNCSTKDLLVDGSVEASGHKVFYACYEESNFDNNGIRYIQSDESYVSGDVVSCGDAIHITKCFKKIGGSGRTGVFSEYCEFDQINGNSALGTVYRSRIANNSVTTCANKYTAYFHEDSTISNITIDGDGLECANTNTYDWGICSSSASAGKTVYTPDTSNLMYLDKKFIGWAADDDGIDVNCSGNLVTGNSVVLTSDVNYYACYEQDDDGCYNSRTATDVVGGPFKVQVCYNADNNLNVTPVSEEYDDLLQCADGYYLDKISTTNIVENTCVKSGTCYKTYELSCLGSRPKITATSAMVNDSGYGTINFSVSSKVGIKGYRYSSYYEKPTINSKWDIDSAGNYDVMITPGTVFLWAIDNHNQISYAAMTSVIDKVNVDTTVETLEVKTKDGETLNTESYAFDLVDDGITSSDYVRLSNPLEDSSKILASGFNPFDTAYKVTTSSDKITVYATLTSKDASYISGYEPRTVELDYGVNTVLIKIQNKKGKVRTYTIIVTREDDRDASNILKSLTVSEGKIDFDSYKTEYIVSVGKNIKYVNVKGEILSSGASYVDSFGPRKIELKNDSTTIALKVKSETGSIRAYTITFIKSGEETNDSNQALLSSLSLSKAYIAFDKNVYDYNTTVDFEIDSININALAENGGDSVTLYRLKNGISEVISNKNISLNVGTNNITIIVANDLGKTRKYSINIMRKENGLDISSDTSLSMLDVDGFNIEFDPEKYNYEVKIKREKTLVIAATPKNNRSEVYIRGNDNLTAFSIVKIKVVAEDGQSKEYTIDIKKDTVNKTIETVGLISGLFIIICGIIIIRIKRRRKSVNDYYAE